MSVQFVVSVPSLLLKTTLKILTSALSAVLMVWNYVLTFFDSKSVRDITYTAFLFLTLFFTFLICFYAIADVLGAIFS